MRTILLLIFFAIAGQASGQYFDKMFLVSWVANAPVANKDFVSSATARGGRLGYRELINPRFTMGVDLSMASYDDYVPRQTYTSSGSAITTDFTHFANTFGATLSGEYLFREEKRLMPYAGLGAGIGYNNYAVYYNIFSSSDNAFGFLGRVKTGAWYRLKETGSWAINASVHLEYSTAKSADMGYKYFLNPGFELGVVFLDW